MLQSQNWINSKVTNEPFKDKISSIALERLDGLKFRVVKESGNTFQVLYEQTGLELIWVTELFKEKKRQRKATKHGSFSGVKAKFVRVVRTDRAIDDAPSEDDLILSCEVKDRQSIGIASMGKRSLRRCLELQSRLTKELRNRTFHWGNVTYETDVENLVGIVAWIKEGENQNKTMHRELLEHVRSRCTFGGNPSMDLVFCGDPFDDREDAP